jgi:hypothetical protein
LIQHRRELDMNELELVVLKRDIPEHGLARGDVGTVVHVYDNGAAYEVESNDVRPRGGKEILHTRSLG